MLASAETLFSLESDGEEARRCCYLIFVPRKPRTANCVHVYFEVVVVASVTLQILALY